MAALILLAFLCWLIPSVLFAELKPDDFVVHYIQTTSKDRTIYEMTCLGGPLIVSIEPCSLCPEQHAHVIQL